MMENRRTQVLRLPVRHSGEKLGHGEGVEGVEIPLHGFNFSMSTSLKREGGHSEESHLKEQKSRAL